MKVLKLTALALAVAAIAPGAAMAGTPTAPTLVSSYTSTDTATQSVIGVTQSSGLTITTANGGTTYGVGFTDTLPGGVVLDNPVSATFSGCGTPVDDPSVTGGTLVVTANSNENTITVSGAVVKTTANCVLTFAVPAGFSWCLHELIAPSAYEADPAFHCTTVLTADTTAAASWTTSSSRAAAR